MIELNKIYNEDCLIGLKKIPNKSVNLIAIDPPYNIGKADWDKINNYVEWMGKVFKECERVLKDNGSFYFFHNDFEQMAELQVWLKNNTQFVFKQMIVWDKFNGSKWNQLNAIVYSEDNRNYSKQAEYCLYYTLQGKFIETSFSTVIKKQMKELNLKEMDFRKLKTSKNGNPTGWCSNIIKGKNIPTESDWDLICKLIGKYDYKLLLNKYMKSRYIFNNQNLPSVWQHEPIKQNGHTTPKPIEILKNIILTSSNEGDTILDCFMGSGSTAIACIYTNRNYIGFELNENYYTIAKNRIDICLENNKLHIN